MTGIRSCGAEQQLNEYFAGGKEFSIALDMRARFQKNVWGALLEIPLVRPEVMDNLPN